MQKPQRHLLKSASSVLSGTLFLIGLATLFPVKAEINLDAAKLVQERRCIACHSMTNYLIGPPFLAISARHSQHKDIMVDVLAEKIILGGAGNWGVVPMVPNQHVSWDEARAISKWILQLDSALHNGDRAASSNK